MWALGTDARSGSGRGERRVRQRATPGGHRLRKPRRAADGIAARGELRVPVERAAEIIWVLTSPGVARLLGEGRGWNTDTDWLEDPLTDAPARPGTKHEEDTICGASSTQQQRCKTSSSAASASTASRSSAPSIGRLGEALGGRSVVMVWA